MRLQPANRLAYGGREDSLASLAKLFADCAHAAGVGARERLAVVSSDQRALFAAGVGLHERRADGAVVSTAAASPTVRGMLLEEGYSLLELGESGVLSHLQRVVKGHRRRSGRIALLTSGTTGQPKLLVHTWKSLRTLRSGSVVSPYRWLVTYLPGTYAWFQMLTLWMFVAGQTLVASAHSSPESIWDEGLAAGVEAVSSTPTFWRYLLAMRPGDELARAPLAQITLGGEPVHQDLLDRLRALFPAARLTHIYASTEVGAAIVVHDGREGFPARWLEERRRGRCQLREVDGILQVQSPFAAEGSGGEGGWHATGDRIEIHGDRAVIAGRSGRDVLNVGGRKVSVSTIEEALAASPLIAWCRVRGVRAPFVGALVAADVVVSEAGRAMTRHDLERNLTAFCAACGFAEWMVPRLWQFLDRIPLTSAFKVDGPNG